MYSGKEIDDQLKTRIIEAIRPIRSSVQAENEASYFFIFDSRGVERLFADRPEFEGKNMLALYDTNGKFVVKDMIDLVYKKKEGAFYEYTWTKPGMAGKGFPKEAYV